MKSLRSSVARWIAELILVFVGAYAAFWLNGFQQRQQDVKRRDQILAALEREVSEGMANAREQGAVAQASVAQFERALADGQMPPVRPFVFTTDYSPSDIAAMLQSGGFDLLDVKTLMAVREMESALRGGLAEMKHYQDLSDALIVPNLDQDISFFYDPDTKQLRKKFSAYPKALHATATLFHIWEKTESELLTQIQAERHKR
jgi:hypothetical protein